MSYLLYTSTIQKMNPLPSSSNQQQQDQNEYLPPVRMMSAPPVVTNTSAEGNLKPADSNNIRPNNDTDDDLNDRLTPSSSAIARSIDEYDATAKRRDVSSHSHKDEINNTKLHRGLTKSPPSKMLIKQSLLSSTWHGSTWHGGDKGEEKPLSPTRHYSSHKKGHKKNKKTPYKKGEEKDHQIDGDHKDVEEEEREIDHDESPISSPLKTMSPTTPSIRNKMKHEGPTNSPPPAPPVTPEAPSSAASRKGSSRIRSKSSPTSSIKRLSDRQGIQNSHKLPIDLPLVSPTTKTSSPISRTERQLSPLRLSGHSSHDTDDTIEIKNTTKTNNNHDSSSSSLNFVGTSSHHTTQSTESMQSRASTGSSHNNNAIPMLYRYARKGVWDEFAQHLSKATKQESIHAYRKDGTTALHLAVMSRTGYIESFRNNSSSSTSFSYNHNINDDSTPQVATLEVIEEMIQKEPELGMMKCTLNGYTPLTYACLVCNENYNTEDAAAMVRLFLQYCPESIHIFTDDGLSPVDIHIVSYSHHHTDKEDESKLGKTSTAVLRTLLNHSPELANLRLADKEVDGNTIQVVDGPLELLYKCNVKVFSKATMDEVYCDDDEGTVRSEYTIPEKRQHVVDEVKKWWIWTWAILLLKYGSKAINKKPGTRFSAVHTATSQVGVPTPLLSICLYAFPRQIKLPIEEISDLGNLPLHAVCSWPCDQDKSLNRSEPTVSTRKIKAINRILDEYPLSVKINNKRGESPLELALNSCTHWDTGIRRLVKAHPKALKLQSRVTGLYPFMTAAVVAGKFNEIQKRDKKTPSQSPRKRFSISTLISKRNQDLQHMRTIYGLLRSNPKVLVNAYQHGQKGEN